MAQNPWPHNTITIDAPRKLITVLPNHGYATFFEPMGTLVGGQWESSAKQLHMMAWALARHLIDNPDALPNLYLGVHGLSLQACMSCICTAINAGFGFDPNSLVGSPFKKGILIIKAALKCQSA